MKTKIMILALFSMFAFVNSSAKGSKEESKSKISFDVVLNALNFDVILMEDVDIKNFLFEVHTYPSDKFVHVDMHFEIDPEIEIAVENWLNEKLEIYREKELEIETWMHDGFGTGREKELEIEDWMCEEFKMKVASKPVNADLFEKVDKEDELIIEDWMSIPFSATDEENLNIEDWMVNF